MDSARNNQAARENSRCDEAVLRTVREAALPDRPSVGGDALSKPPAIQGVELERLSAFHDNRGSLIPALDIRKSFWREPVTYAYGVTVRPGAIKGWGMHLVQADRYCILKGRLRVVLFDGRDDSPDRGMFSQIWFTDESPGLLRIPPGVWHADQNWGDTDVLITNYPTHAFNPENPDKFRIDPHAGIIPFDWKLKDG